ncbi:hypothetical protein [Pigmentiphaga litoralis]|uniref:Uncharacterized protein n=1 Tax=Pigmentiphaga litoralis TaxID=516702 RepID=A0A7Y9IV24_9BURK|nr:hypothetical protein [Pigmentiphaga litoralis]NYE23627.1 hypothetical protein [Pigmentiphaga litoralis]NYE82759.1 hypothetical protein [Pigmentiphaga litoralis]
MSTGRILAWMLLAAVLALAFAGYQRAGLVMNWETLMALCGVR